MVTQYGIRCHTGNIQLSAGLADRIAEFLEQQEVICKFRLSFKTFHLALKSLFDL